MSKKYLSIEEAAQMLGMETSELNRLREKSEIRAFADRGTWKFKLEDVENLGRSRQADSDPEFPLHDVPSSSGDVLSEDDEDALSEQPTIIRRPSADDSNSDSDVRLIFDDSMGVTDEGSDENIGISLSDSDSDVQLTSESKVSKGTGSDSDVRLVGSDSDVDVKLVGQGSDSDVKLVGSSGSDSDVAIVPDRKPGAEKKGPKSGKNLGKGTDFDLPLSMEDDEEESFSLSPLEGDHADQTIHLSPVSESGSVLDEDDSDEGISLAGDSGISLASASGISLEQPNDSGISLDDDSALQLTGDSGITLADDGGSSGISLASPSSKLPGKKPTSSVKGGKSPVKAGKKPPESSDDLHATMPMMESPLLDDDDSHDTAMEVPLFDDGNQDSDLDISADLGGSSTSVITLDDEEDVDGHSPTMVKKKRSGEDSEDLLEEDGMFDSGTAEIDEVEVSDDVIGEDDELEDVFGAEDEDFEAGMETGESHADIPVSAPARGMAAPVEYDWGVPSFVGLALSTVLMIVCGTVMFDLVRNMWYTDMQSLNPVSSTLLDALKDGFKG